MHLLLQSIQGIQKVNKGKKNKKNKKDKEKIVFLPSMPTKKAHNRTNKFLLLNTSTNEIHTKYPGELKSFLKKIKGNYNSVMAQRSTYPHKDIDIWTVRGNFKVAQWKLLAITHSIVS